MPYAVKSPDNCRFRSHEGVTEPYCKNRVLLAQRLAGSHLPHFPSPLFRLQGRGGEDRATRGTEAGGPRAKRSGGVSEANVQDSSSDLQTSDASSRINVTDNSALGLPKAVIRIACSKGTYVRAFARDLGEALGSGAHLDSLQRSRSGLFRIENALTVDQTINLLTAWQANQ